MNFLLITIFAVVAFAASTESCRGDEDCHGTSIDTHCFGLSWRTVCRNTRCSCQSATHAGRVWQYLWREPDEQMENIQNMVQDNEPGQAAEQEERKDEQMENIQNMVQDNEPGQAAEQEERNDLDNAQVQVEVNGVLQGQDSMDEADAQMDCTYDFAVLYCDEDLVRAEAITDYLERGEIDGRKLKGFYRDRDIQPGRYIIEGRVDGITTSRLILLVISGQSVNNAWWTQDRYIAVQHRLENPNRKNTVIPIYVSDPQHPYEKPDDLKILQELDYEANGQSGFWRQLKKLFVADEEVEVNLL